MANETILIVQDDFLAAERLRVVLEQAGYRIAGLAGRTAEAVCLTEQEAPDLAIIDMMLEIDVDGIATATELAKRREIKILITTGFPDSLVESEGVHEFACAVLKKPFTDEEILQAVKDCLSRPEAPSGRPG